MSAGIELTPIIIATLRPATLPIRLYPEEMQDWLNSVDVRNVDGRKKLREL